MYSVHIPPVCFPLPPSLLCSPSPPLPLLVPVSLSFFLTRSPSPSHPVPFPPSFPPSSFLPTHSLAAPKFTMLPTDLDLLYGTTATIACAFNGFPKPTIDWRVDRETITSKDDRIKINSCATSSILEIVRLCYDDVGTYTCFITNNRGSNSAQMTLNIHGK